MLNSLEFLNALRCLHGTPISCENRGGSSSSQLDRAPGLEPPFLDVTSGTPLGVSEACVPHLSEGEGSSSQRPAAGSGRKQVGGSNGASGGVHSGNPAPVTTETVSKSEATVLSPAHRLTPTERWERPGELSGLISQRGKLSLGQAQGLLWSTE